MHKGSKLGTMTNVGESRLVKVIFSNIHKISDACANAFSRYIMIAQCMKNVFTFYYGKIFLWKNGVSEKIKAHLPQHPQALQQLFSPHLFNFIRTIFSPTPFKKEGRDYAFYMKDYKGEAIKLLPSCMTDFLFTEL